MPKLTHPDATGRSKTIEVSPDMVPMYVSQGWTVKETAPAKPSTDKK